MITQTAHLGLHISSSSDFSVNQMIYGPEHWKIDVCAYVYRATVIRVIRLY